MNIKLRNLLLACNFSEWAKERGGSTLLVQCSYGPDQCTVYIMRSQLPVQMSTGELS